jgi:hypothetical protein
VNTVQFEKQLRFREGAACHEGSHRPKTAVRRASSAQRSGHAQVAPPRLGAFRRFINQQQVGMDRCGERDGRAFSEGTWFLLMAHGV